MDVLIEALEDFKKKLDKDKAFDFAFDSDMQELLIELNQSQLYDLGQDSEGASLGSYSPYTIKIKQLKGQPTNRITLYDTGEFYKSFKAYYEDGSIVIDADAEKDDTNLFDQFGVDILGLDDSNMSIFVNEIIQKIKFFILNK